ncbi:MAG: ATP-binding protein [Magnetospirillum sp. WYHS-4]
MGRLAGSLALRIFLLLVGAVLLAVGLTSELARRDRAQVIEQFRDRAGAARLATVVQMLSPLSAEARVAAVRALPEREWRIALDPPADAEALPAAPALADLLGDAVVAAARVDGGWSGRDGDARPRLSVARVTFPDGQAARLQHVDLRPPRPPLGERAFLSVNGALFAAILAAAAWMAVRLALRPLARLARAAEDFGRDMERPPLDETGPTEMRQAAKAFNAMQKRIRAQVAERTRILAAIAHDLKTPLTRMRLRLEPLADDDLKGRLLEDLRSMNGLVEEGLDLAQSLESREPVQRVDLGSLLQSLCDDAADAGLDVSYEGEAMAQVLARPDALRRVFSNLIDNAVKYGTCARVGLDTHEGVVRVTVRDQGPGIPEDHLVDVLKPFYRLEASRSRETGGTGLGLAIAANLVGRQQGGRLELVNRPHQGGLEARVELPLAQSMTKMSSASDSRRRGPS